MKKLNKKGFTIVELVIVIAVIAVLAAVLIPTFSGVVNRANESAAMQQAEIAYKNLLATYSGVNNDTNPITVSDNADKGITTNWNFWIKADGYYFEVKNGQFQSQSGTKTKPTGTATIYVVKEKEETLAMNGTALEAEATAN